MSKVPDQCSSCGGFGGRGHKCPTGKRGTEMTYSDIDGRKRLLSQVVREKPEWAASRIKECERLEVVEIPGLHARISKLESEVESLRRHLQIEREAHARKLDTINSAFSKLREAVSE